MSLKSEAISYAIAGLKLSMNLYFLLKEIVNLTKQMESHIECSCSFRVVKCFFWPFRLECSCSPSAKLTSFIPRLFWRKATFHVALFSSHSSVAPIRDANEKPTRWSSNSPGKVSREDPRKKFPHSLEYFQIVENILWNVPCRSDLTYGLRLVQCPSRRTFRGSLEN